MNKKSDKISALINLLEDEDNHVSTLAMEQLLHEGGTDDLVKEFQEAASPLLRSRIHQLGNVLTLRRRRTSFLAKARQEKLNLWQGTLQINYLYSPRVHMDAVNLAFRKLARRLPKSLSTVRLATFMRKEGFRTTLEDSLGSDLFLLEDVIAQSVGSSVLLCVITKALGDHVGWDSSIVLYKGKHCILDSNSNLIEPSENWKVTHIPREDRLHTCSNWDVWLALLSQLYLSAMLEGKLQSIHRVGSILSEFCGGSVKDLPYPMGC